MAEEAPNLFGRLGGEMKGVSNCPHCGVANPQLPMLWASDPLSNSTDEPTSRWGIFRCTTCGNGIMAKGAPGSGVTNPEIVEIFPKPKSAHDDLPPLAIKYLQQAYETLHAPDAAAVMAGSAVDAMLKDCEYEDGSLYERIDKAVEDHLLTDGMGKWAHAVRLESNRPRHADKENPNVTPEEAKKAVEFAEALGHFLFVLTARIEHAIGDD